MNQLAELRRALDLTQTQLAKRIGAGRRTVAGWERGETKPMFFYRTKLARVFKVRVDQLGFEEDEPM